MRIVRSLGLILLLSISSCGELGGNIEEYYPTYEDLKNKRDALAQYLPENSTDIHHFVIGEIDTNYHFFDATVQIKSLEDFILSHNYFNSEQHTHGCSYTDGKFDSLFHKRPDWWNQESMSEFEDNYLIVFADNNNYGKGCWLFYDDDMKKIRVFTWSQQWLSQEKALMVLKSDGKMPEIIDTKETFIPTTQEIVQLFDLPKDFTLDSQRGTAIGETDYGNIIWEWNYSNTDHCLFDITVALAEGGSFLSSEMGIKIRELEKELLNTVKSNTSDNRTIYNLPIIVSPSGSLDLTVLTSKDGNYDLMIFISKDFERDVIPEEQMENPIQLRKSSQDVIQPLEEIVYKYTSMQKNSLTGKTVTTLAHRLRCLRKHCCFRGWFQV